MKRSGPVALLLAAAVLLLAGCSAIPMSGPVQLGPTEAADDSNIVFIPNPPAAGASRQQIVAGFLAAASGGGDFHVAREYLSPKALSTWQPRSRVLVQRAQPVVTATSATSVRAQVPLSAVVDAEGAYAPSADTSSLEFQLVQRSGQWRIDDAPNGIVLGETVFQKVYTPQALQFFDASWSRLVPDARWFPIPLGRTSSSAPQPATVIRALIAGPSGPLTGGVTANALHGARLESVQAVDGDLTTVSLTVPQRNPTVQQTTRMQQQLVQSLSLRTASALRLFVNGTAVGTATPVVDQPTSVPASFVLSGRRFGSLSSSGSFTEDRTLGAAIVATRPTAVTVSLHQRLAAVLTGAGQVAAVTTTGSRVLDQGHRSVVDPTLDQRGWIYSIPGDASGELIASTAKGVSVQLGPGAGGDVVQSIEVSPDGTRLLVLATSSIGPRAFVVGIERDADGTPTGLTRAQYPVALGGSDGMGVDATWVDDATVAAMVQSSNGSSERVWIQPLGLVGFQEGQLANATSIVGGTSLTDLRVLLQNGDIWTWATNTWQPESSTGTDVSVLAVQR